MDANRANLEFDRLCNDEPELRKILGSPDQYTVDEKQSIVLAYKKGGLEGLYEIIEYEDDDEDQDAANSGAQGLQGVNAKAANNNQQEDSDEDDEREINLDNEEDV